MSSSVDFAKSSESGPEWKVPVASHVEDGCRDRSGGLACHVVRPVTEIPTMDQLIHLSEEEAARAYFDSRNCRTLFRLILGFAMVAMVLVLIMTATESYRQLAVPLVNLLLIRLLYALRERPFFTTYFRPILLGFLMVQAILWKACSFDAAASFHAADFVAPAVFLFFRLRSWQLAVPLGFFWLLSVGRHLLEVSFGDKALALEAVIGQTLITLVVFAIITHLSRKQRRALFVDWRREAHRHRERRRMQGELDDARKIQLSMLPKTEPRLPWLEISAISLPASEVGGDYYDYFSLSPTRQAIVLGDVAGHGVASGLLLAGVRSCLHLLQEWSLGPAEILTKIDVMLRQTAVNRSFVTLLYAVFDAEEKTLTFSSAGHPPIVHRRWDGGLDELEVHSLPLGTHLGRDRIPEERQVAIHPGDLFIFTTDGLSEALDAKGEIYGDERLHRRLEALPLDKSARGVRDAVMADVWSFKGDGEQLDDITVVVARVR